MHDAERWLPIAGYEGRYEVSDHGRVRSLDRWTHHKNGTRQFIRGVMMALSPHHPDTPYPKVGLCKSGKQTSAAVHRLVLEAFVGPCPPGMEACHKDGDHTNSSLDNLRWDTHRENWRDSVRHGTAFTQSRIERCIRGHLMDEENTYVQVCKGRTKHVCRACSRDRRAAKLDRPVYSYVDGTHCRNGHEYTPETLRMTDKGRTCLVCRQASRDRERMKARQLRRHAQSA